MRVELSVRSKSLKSEDTGVVRWAVEIFNQKDELVATYDLLTENVALGGRNAAGDVRYPALNGTGAAAMKVSDVMSTDVETVRRTRWLGRPRASCCRPTRVRSRVTDGNASSA